MSIIYRFIKMKARNNNGFLLVLVLLTAFLNRKWIFSSKSDTTNEYLDKLRVGCSDICNTDLKGSKSLYFDEIKKKVDCIGIWKNTDIDKPRSGPAPSIPPEMMQYFSYGGRIKICHFHQSCLMKYI